MARFSKLLSDGDFAAGVTFVEATVFVASLQPEDEWTEPNFIGLKGCLDRMRFAVDPRERFLLRRSLIFCDGCSALAFPASDLNAFERALPSIGQP
jgi:hypothetical protein